MAHISTLLERARTSVLNQSERDDSSFNAQVAIEVLETAEHEYEEAAENGTIVEM